MRRISSGLIALLGCGALLAGPKLPATAATATAGAECTVDYLVTSQWATGFTVEIIITNDGPTALSWVLQYGYSGNQRLAAGWDASWVQSGENISVSDNSPLPSGGSVTLSAAFTYSGADNPPTVFTLNGVPCNVVGSVPPSPTPSPTVTVV
jgi:cellulose 1,4-beta-cellobiosidase